MLARPIRPASRPLDATVRIPGSKSLTNRAMVLAALADGPTELTGALFSDDTELMIACLQQLGIRVIHDADQCRIHVEGCRGQVPATDAELYCGNSGTTIRFCTAACALGAGPYRLDGNERMQMRPIGPLIEGLRQLGALAGYDDRDGYPPVVIRRGGLAGGSVSFHNSPSSQYISAVLMAAPCARRDVFLESTGQMPSAPYVAMTLRLMERFGVSVVEQTDGPTFRAIVPAPQRYTSQPIAIEPDASNASYFLAAPAIAGGTVRVEGLGTSSIQGDVRFVDVLERMGCQVERGTDFLAVTGPDDPDVLAGVDVDLGDMPDVAQTLAVVALFAQGPTRIRNIQSLRIKETDRIHALATELTRLGAEVELQPGELTISPPQTITPVRVATYDDHRMAMSFALAGLRVDGIEILDPACVNKTFPDFFDRFEKLTA